MALFLISNLMISALAILHNRTGKTSINARLLVSSFALICWVIPFSLARDLFPKEASVNLPWITAQHFENIDFNTVNQVAPTLNFSLANVFISACLIGLVFSLVRLFVHFKWLRNLNSQSQLEPLKYFKGIPVSFSTVLANSNDVNGRESERFSLNFKRMPIAATTHVLRERYQVNEVIVDPSLTSVIFTNFKVDKVNLAELSALTNITWEIKNDKLIVSLRDGEIISKIMSDEEYDKSQGNEDELGVFLKFELKHVTMKNGVQHIWRKEASIWANFDSPFSMSFDNTREISFIVTDLDERILINSSIYSVEDDNSKVLIASPKVFTLYGNKATIQEGSEEKNESDIWTITIDPKKIKKSNIAL